MNYGFFEEREVAKPSKMGGLSGCARCGLSKTCKTPKMKPSGAGQKKILVLAEAPGEVEDVKGTQLIGECGQLLRSRLKTLGVDLDKDCRKINAVNCRPPKNRTPSAREIEDCRPMVLKEISDFRPELILLLGGSAIQSYFGHRWKKDLDGVTKWRGWVIPDFEMGAWVCPTYHPSFILRDRQDSPANLIFTQDLARAIKTLGNPLPSAKDGGKLVRVISDPEDAKQAIIALLDEAPPMVAIDYETTGLKPFKKGHRIVSCALAWEPDKSIAFPMSETVRPYLVGLLKNPEIQKVASNLAFEELWSEVILKTPVAGWVWDTMQAAHILDNRAGITGLKFQMAVHFGIMDYSSPVSPYLESKEKGGNGFNRITEANPVELLSYNGQDALYELWLAIKQMKELGCLN